MRIGQIVFIDKNFVGPVQTGIINRKEKCQTGEFWWYEVLCNDGQNHVLPEYLLSPADHAGVGLKGDWSMMEKYYKNKAPLYKKSSHLITLYT